MRNILSETRGHATRIGLDTKATKSQIRQWCAINSGKKPYTGYFGG
jgi:hypothetical protein